MKYIYVGKICNTHALKGEVRIISDFELKDKVFKIDNKFYIGNNKNLEIVETYRKHKQFDMVKFKNIDTITDVVKYKGQKVYMEYDDLHLKEDEVLMSDLINMDVILNDKTIGKISDYRIDNGNKMLILNDKYIPYNKDFISKIDKENNKIYYHDIEVFL